jgi:hypothetical protein
MLSPLSVHGHEPASAVWLAGIATLQISPYRTSFICLKEQYQGALQLLQPNIAQDSILHTDIP